MRFMKSEIIGVQKEAYFYLNRISRLQRGCKPLSTEQEDQMWNRCYKNRDGLKVLDDDSIGGGDGTYNGTWTTWNVNLLRQMLEEGGYSWTELGTHEYINV